MARMDSVFDQRLRLEEQELAAAAQRRADAARAKARDDAERRRLIAERYDDSFRAFGTEVPAAVDDEAPAAYRRRLFNRLARKLAPDHELAQIRADDVSGQPIVFDNFEAMLLDAAKAEGERPSTENLPSDGSLIARNRVDDMGAKTTEFFGRESFVKSMGLPGRRVLRICNPKTGDVLHGPRFRRTRATRCSGDAATSSLTQPSKRKRHMVREVRSPWNTTGNEPMRGYSPGSRSSPSNAARSDSGHRAGHDRNSGLLDCGAVFRHRPLRVTGLCRAGVRGLSIAFAIFLISNSACPTPASFGFLPPRLSRQSNTWTSRLGRDVRPAPSSRLGVDYDATPAARRDAPLRRRPS